jgi:hypothetical protein
MSSRSERPIKWGVLMRGQPLEATKKRRTKLRRFLLLRDEIFIRATASAHENPAGYSPPVPVFSTSSPSSPFFSRSLVKQPAQVNTVRPATLRVLPPRIIAGCLHVPHKRVQLPATERLRGVAVCWRNFAIWFASRKLIVTLFCASVTVHFATTEFRGSAIVVRDLVV